MVPPSSALPGPTPAGRTHYAIGPGFILGLIRSRPVWTRAQLVALTGLARSTLSERIDQLAAAKLVMVGKEAMVTGGRPAESIRFNAAGGTLLVADIGGSHSRIGITDLHGSLIATTDKDIDISAGPDQILGSTLADFHTLLAENSIDASHVRGIGIGMPGPVDTATGRIVRPRTMPGWDTVAVPDYFRASFPNVPVLVDKDANIMALGEFRTSWSHEHSTTITVKVGMGIGCGLIVNDTVLHGARGAAGDIAHISRGSDVQCLCGQNGCVEAVAGGRAIAAKLNAAGRTVTTSSDIVDLVREGDALAVRLVRQAGREIGEVLIPTIALINPSLVVIGGNLADSPEPLLAGIRESVYAHSHPLSTEALQIVPSKTGPQAGLTGAAMLTLDTIFAENAVDAALSA
ncbi:MAG: ROK family protein [Propionibacteriaceae bacterium]|jgi:predicted NBD/HSP70 family sugar kinase|nr:ROK family protein [Propionibacteriaceae bacterium]